MSCRLRWARLAAAVVALSACVNPWLPPGAHIDPHGCINVDRTPKYPRLDFRKPAGQSIGHWYFDGRQFGWSFEEDDTCILPT